jgi:hypothetical protein
VTCEPSASMIVAPARCAIGARRLVARADGGPDRVVLPGRVPGLVAEGAGGDGPLGQPVHVGVELTQVGGEDLAEPGRVDYELGGGPRSFADRKLLSSTAVVRTLSWKRPTMPASVSPSSGANAATTAGWQADAARVVDLPGGNQADSGLGRTRSACRVRPSAGTGSAVNLRARCFSGEE